MTKQEKDRKRGRLQARPVSNGMQLLVITQTVDRNDPVLGFFHRWVEEFAKRYERIHLICLQEGEHTFPVNVSVHSLGKSAQGRGASGWEMLVLRVMYVMRLYRYLWGLRHEYDVVFVHMNQEYVLLGGLVWQLLRKRIILWRNHKKGSLATRVACALVDVVCYTSPDSFVAKSRNAHQMPIGIDTIFFAPPVEPPRSDSILLLGRLDPIKNVGVFIEAARNLERAGVSFVADVYGDPTPGNEQYARGARESALSLSNVLTMRRGITNEEAREAFRSHAIYVNLTGGGSFDKTIGEAMASGCIVIVAHTALQDVVGSDFIVDVQNTQSVTHALRVALALSKEERNLLATTYRAYIEREHSLALLADKLWRICALEQ